MSGDEGDEGAVQRAWDMQTGGRCALPPPLTSFSQVTCEGNNMHLAGLDKS